MAKRDGADIKNIKAQYAEFFDNSGGTYMVEKLATVRDAELSKADDATTADEAFGHLKKANGIIWVLEHVKTMIERDPLE